MEWKVISTTYLSDHRYFKARKDVCAMPNGTIVPEYFVVELPVSVCALAITQAGEVVLSRQYRHPIGEVIYEIPGGFSDPGETYLQAIERELKEETGYQFQQIIEVGKTAANPGVLSNYTYFYLALGGIKTADQHLDAYEELEVLLTPVEEVRRMLQDNNFAQALHTSCLFYAFQKYDRLFPAP